MCYDNALNKITLCVIGVGFRCRRLGDRRQSSCRRSDRSNFGSMV